MRRKESLLAAGGLLLLLLAAALLLLRPRGRELARLHEKVAALEVELARPIDDPEAIARLQSELAKLKQFGQSRMMLIPEESDIAGLVGNISSFISDIGLSGNELNSGIPEQLDEASAMPLTLHISGAFPAIAQVVEYIETLPRLVRVRRMQIVNVAAAQAPGTEMEIEADLTLEVFYAPRSGAGQSSRSTEPQHRNLIEGWGAKQQNRITARHSRASGKQQIKRTPLDRQLQVMQEEPMVEPFNVCDRHAERADSWTGAQQAYYLADWLLAATHSCPEAAWAGCPCYAEVSAG